MDYNLFFSPARALQERDNRRHFVGRQSEFKRALDGLNMKGAALFIHGDRGIGKTSFAWQLMEILKEGTTSKSPVARSGHLNKIKIPAIEPIWLQCRSEMGNPASVLAALLMPGIGFDRTIRDAFSSIFTDPLRVEAIDRTSKILGGFWSVETKTKKGRSQSESIDQRLGKIATVEVEAKNLFFQILAEAKRKLKNKKQIVIFLDEFDLIFDKKDFGKLVKECKDARFVFVGITEDVEPVLQDHMSVYRKTLTTDIEIPHLSNEDIKRCLDEAENVGKEIKTPIEFLIDYRNKLVHLSGGVPNIVQYMGYETVRWLIEKHEGSKTYKADGKVFESVKEGLYGEATSKREFGAIRNVVGSNANRSRLLEELANIEHGWIDEQDFKALLSSSEKRGYENNMKAFVKQRLIKRHKGRIAFERPELKIIISHAIESGKKLIKDRK